MAAVEPPQVLILDPNPVDRQNIQRMLAEAGCRVEFSARPSEAIRLLLKTDFDVLVVDPSLSEKSARFIADASRLRPWMRVILVTSHPDRNPDAASPAMRRFAHLQKPLADASFQKVVLDACQEKRRQLATSDQGLLHRMVSQAEAVCEHARISLSEGGFSSLLDKLSMSIRELLPCAATGVLAVEEGTPVIRVHANVPVSEEFLTRIEDELLGCYESLADRHVIRGFVPIARSGEISANGPTEPGSLFSIPIINDERPDGVLAFAALEKDTYGDREVTFLCHMANHFSAMFPTVQKMRHLAIRDSLTGLYNRGYFEQEFKKSWLASRRYANPISVIMMDIDAMKALNDSYGHLLGDAVLQELAQLMNRTARVTDTTARYGGDEISVILPNSNAEQAKNAADRLLTVISQHVFCEKRRPLHLSVSIGVATSTDMEFNDATELLAFADQACYLAKENGKSRVCTGAQVQRQGGQVKSTPAPEPNAPAKPEEPPPLESTGQILVVDDEPTICQTFEVMLTHKGFSVITETSAQRAIEIIRARAADIDVILTDLRMPDMDGIQLLDAVRKISPDLVTILVTGFSSVDNAIAAMRVGAYDFVRKPVDFDELEFVVRRGVERRQLRRQVDAYQSHIETMLDSRTESLRQTLNALEASYMATMEALSTILAVRETHTAMHDRRVSSHSVEMGTRMGLSEAQLVTIRRGALLHDIGKIGVPDAVLQKPGPLNPAEWQFIKEHPTIGHQILNNIPFLKDEAEMVYTHHERFDGGGYPRGLAGEAICPGARIFAVADTFDALRSDRVYRKAVAMDQAVEIIRDGAGKQFDPAVVKVFLSCCDVLNQVYK